MRDAAARGRFHPLAIVTGRRHGALVGRAKRLVVRRLYDHLARRHPLPAWTTMNYGYAPLPGQPACEAAYEMATADADEANGLALYRHVAGLGRTDGDLGGLDVVEIGSGRGGGAAFVARTMTPRRLTGVDVAVEAVALSAARYADIPNLDFLQGDAEALRLPAASADLVLNVESAHCYASMPRFLGEVARVLRPGGQLLFAGFAARRGGAYDRLLAAFDASPLALDAVHDITPHVLAALARDEARKRRMIGQELRGLMKSFATGAYAMDGTPMRRSLEAGETIYVSAVLTNRSASVV